jgi:hypothetical protein
LLDYSRCAADLGITPAEFLDRYNPMVRKIPQEYRQAYRVEAPGLRDEHYRIVLINNSMMPVAPPGGLLGVLHEAHILTPDATKTRVVNSIQLAVRPPGEMTEAVVSFGPEEVRAFVEEGAAVS